MSDASLRKSFETDSDWALVIKLHAYVEASLNFLLVKHFGDQRLEEVVSYLDISDRRRGKLAFKKALDFDCRQIRCRHVVGFGPAILFNFVRKPR